MHQKALTHDAPCNVQAVGDRNLGTTPHVPVCHASMALSWPLLDAASFQSASPPLGDGALGGTQRRRRRGDAGGRRCCNKSQNKKGLSPSGMGRSRARSAGAAEGIRAADAVAAAMALACDVGFSGCHPSTCGRFSQAFVCVFVQIAVALACSVGISKCRAVSIPVSRTRSGRPPFAPPGVSTAIPPASAAITETLSAAQARSHPSQLMALHQPFTSTGAGNATVDEPAASSKL